MPVPPKRQRAAEPTSTAPVNAGAALLEPDQSAAAETGGVPYARHSPAFLLRHHPGAWDVAKVDGKDVLLPDLNMQVLRPGVNGMPTLRNGETMSDAVTRVRQTGELSHFVYLDPAAPVDASCLPPGVPAGGYRRRFQCRDPRGGNLGYRHVTAWDVPIPTLAGEAQAFRFDRAAYNRWRLKLVDEGLIAAPLPQVVERLVQAYGARVERAAARPYPTEEMRQRRLGVADSAAKAVQAAAASVEAA